MRDILKIGDRVQLITMPGLPYPPTQRIELEVAGFGVAVLRHYASQPGIYEDHDTVLLDDPQGPTRGMRKPNGSVELVDRDLAAARRRLPNAAELCRPLQFDAELPEYSFWEGDAVRVRGLSLGIKRIVDIDYLGLLHRGERFSGYAVANSFTPYVPGSGRSWYRASSLQLVERGPVWEAARRNRDPADKKIKAMLHLVRGEIQSVDVSGRETPAAFAAMVRRHEADLIVPRSPERDIGPSAYRFIDPGIGIFVAEQTQAALAAGPPTLPKVPQPFARRLYPCGGAPDGREVQRVLGLMSVFGGKV